MSKPPKPLAVGYVRVSVGEDDALSLDAQERQLHAYAEANGLHLAAVIRDAGVSAAVPFDKRPGGSRLVRQLYHEDAKDLVLLAVRLDRLFRSSYEAAKWLELWVAAGVRPILLDLGLDLRTPAGRFVFAKLAAAAELERNLLRLRTRDAMGELKRRGLVAGAQPFGARREGPTSDVLVPNRDELAIAAYAIELRSQGWAWWAITKQLVRDGFKPRGKRFHCSTLERACAMLRADPNKLALATECYAEWRRQRAAEHAQETTT